MSLALIDGELVAERKPLNLPQETRKPVICVFDPVGLHALILGFALGELQEKVEIFWQSQFSRTFIGMAGISEEIYPALIAVKKPVLLISELEVIPGEPEYGVEMMANLRTRLKSTPLMVISSDVCLTRAQEEFGEKLKELSIGWFFTWSCLESKPKEQGRLFSIVAEILGL